MEYFVSVINKAEDTYIDVDSVEKDTLKQLQRKVDGYIESANFLFPELKAALNANCFIAEDGTGKPATLVHTNKITGMQKTIFGNIVFAKNREDGETKGLSILESVSIIAWLFHEIGAIVPVKLCCPEEDRDEWDNAMTGLAVAMMKGLDRQEEIAQA